VTKSEEASIPQVFISNDKIQQERKNIMGMTRVFERLYVGDADDADSLSVTNPFGITAVLNVNTEVNQQWRDGITYVFFLLNEYEWIQPQKFARLMITISQLVRGGISEDQCGYAPTPFSIVVAEYDVAGNPLGSDRRGLGGRKGQGDAGAPRTHR